jgi:hypothetical protein
MKITVGVFATIQDGAGRVLLIHRTDCDWWRQPGSAISTMTDSGLVWPSRYTTPALSHVANDPRVRWRSADGEW